MLRGRHLGTGQICRDARGDGRDGADLQLSAAQQPMQRLQPDADPAARVERMSDRTGREASGLGAYQQRFDSPRDDPWLTKTAGRPATS
ncbi:protein of unknown function [Methylocaldum szegediense]|uniref:Uncharacterized protein n=1 Tax=Methylocaldum szegediense TaxID=73780 RepID=A0ABM9I5A1_9GAMM|nr:protein of unknown function [Methylocaldum szegediense]